MEASMPFLLWGGLFVLTVLTEFATQQLVSIWFAAGALAGFLAACFGASPVVQIVLFVVISVVLQCERHGPRRAALHDDAHRGIGGVCQCLQRAFHLCGRDVLEVCYGQRISG